MMRRRSFDMLQLRVQVWNDVSSLQSAYNLGSGEASAAWSLLTEVDGSVCDQLQEIVQHLGFYMCFLRSALELL